MEYTRYNYDVRVAQYYLIFTDNNGVDHVHYSRDHQRKVNIFEIIDLMDNLTREEVVRLEELIHSEDIENLTIAEEIVYQKIE